MTLSDKQLRDTARELSDNMAKAGVSLERTAADLGTTPDYIDQLLHMNPRKLEDTWILKNYLIEKAREAGKEPTPFTALGGDYHVIMFLNDRYIDGKRITP